MRYLCLKTIVDTSGKTLGEEGDFIELATDSLDKSERAQATGILLSNGNESALRQVDADPAPVVSKPKKAKKKASYKTRQMNADDTASD